MSATDTTYHSLLYRNFKEIAADNFRQIIRFYEENEKKIRFLHFEEYFDLQAAYVNALFEIGAYKKYLLGVDQVIEMTITHNIRQHHGEDVFRQLLFRKAASLYNLHDFDKSRYILCELIKIDKNDKFAIQLLTACLRKQPSNWLRVFRAVSIFLFLATALIIFIEVMAIRPFFENYSSDIELIRNISFVSGLLVLGTGVLYHRLHADYKVSRFISCVRQGKRC
mgnify:CR=1 FL=1